MTNDGWLNVLRIYIDDWVTATDRQWLWVPFDEDQFAAYLRSYRRSPCLHMIPPSAPEDL